MHLDARVLALMSRPGARVLAPAPGLGGGVLAPDSCQDDCSFDCAHRVCTSWLWRWAPIFLGAEMIWRHQIGALIWRPVAKRKKCVCN